MKGCLNRIDTELGYIFEFILPFVYLNNINATLCRCYKGDDVFIKMPQLIVIFSFKNNIIRLRSLMREFPIKPLDRAVWLMEHIIQYGGDHLQSPARGLSFAEYYEINLLLAFSLILFIISVIMFYVLKFTLKFAYNVYVSHSKLKSL